MKVITDFHYDRLLRFLPVAELRRMVRDGEISTDDARRWGGLKNIGIGEQQVAAFAPLPPPDQDTEWHGQVKWPWFTARRRGHLLEQRVGQLEARVAHLEQHLLSSLLREAEKK